jgi:ParB-like chromosome segregation protein Spo0J
MKLESVRVDLIEVKNRMRDVNSERVASLAESIRAVGLLNPIAVYSPDDATLDLVAGAHRLAAIKSLGWEHVDVVMFTADQLHAQLAEIDENLMRSELTATQQAEHLQRRKEIWEAMQEAESAGGATCTTGRNTDGTFGDGQKQFAAETAAATGVNKSTVTRATRRARDVCQEARDLIRGTKLDTGTFLDRLAKAGVSPKEQVDRVREALATLAQNEEGERLRKEAEARKEAAKEASYDACNRIAQFLFEKLTNREWTMLIHDFELAGWTLQAKTLRNWEAPSRAA